MTATRKLPIWFAEAAGLIRKGMTQEQAAVAVGVTPRHLRRVIRDTANRAGFVRPSRVPSR